MRWYHFFVFRKRISRNVFWSILTLLFFSAITNLSVSNIEDESFYKHLSFLAFGSLLIFTISKLRFREAKMSVLRHYIYLLLITIGFNILLFYTWKNGLDNSSRQSASRWISLLGFTFQPSTLSYIILMLHTASYCFVSTLIKQRKKLKTRLSFFYFTFGIILPTLLIALSDISTSIIVFFSNVSTLILLKCNLRGAWLSLGAFFTLAAMLFSYAVLVDLEENSMLSNLAQKIKIENQVIRIKNWYHFWQGEDFFFTEEGVVSAESNLEGDLQIRNARAAIVNGGFLGRGAGQGNFKYILPQASNDMVYSILIEENGFLFSFILILAYLNLIFNVLGYSVHTLSHPESRASGMIITALLMPFIYQIIMHIMVNLYLIPATGMALPLVSRGGTSMLISCASIGIIIFILENIKVKKNIKNEPS